MQTLFPSHTSYLFVLNASWLILLPKRGEQPHARVIPSRKPEVKVFIKARSPCKAQPRYRDFHMWCLCLVSVLWSGVFSSQALPCDFGKSVHWAFFAGSSLSLRTTFICNTFPTAELQLLDSSLGSLQFFPFFLVFSLPVLLIQWIQVFKWIYFIKQYAERHLICSFCFNPFALFQLFHPKGERIFTSWRTRAMNQEHRFI